jgi:hypothetical protein
VQPFAGLIIVLVIFMLFERKSCATASACRLRRFEPHHRALQDAGRRVAHTPDAADHNTTYAI